MQNIAELFAALTQPQADVISSATTLLSALLVAIVAPVVFHLLTSKGVRDFREAVNELKTSAVSASDQAVAIRANLTAVSGSVEELGVLLSSVQESVATTQNTLLASRPEEADAADESGAPTTNLDKVKTSWRHIQELAERLASRPEIRGQTRAKYARIDRRGYKNLLATMSADGNLPGELQDWYAAYETYNGAWRRDEPVTDAAVAKISSIEQRLSTLVTDAPPAPTLRLHVPKSKIRPPSNGSVVSVSDDPIQVEQLPPQAGDRVVH